MRNGFHFVLSAAEAKARQVRQVHPVLSARRVAVGADVPAVVAPDLRRVIKRIRLRWQYRSRVCDNQFHQGRRKGFEKIRDEPRDKLPANGRQADSSAYVPHRLNSSCSFKLSEEDS